MNITSLPSRRILFLGISLLVFGMVFEPEAVISMIFRVVGWVMFCISGGVGFLKLMESREQLNYKKRR